MSNNFPRFVQVFVEKECNIVDKAYKKEEKQMKKKILGLLCGGIMAFSLFAAPGNPVKAEETDPCECHDVRIVTGAEKNKIIANLISSQEFKTQKLNIIKDGDNWRGVKGTEVVVHNQLGTIMVGIPYIGQDGTMKMAVFFNGIYMDPSLLQ
jgi:hypothetical protein